MHFFMSTKKCAPIVKHLITFGCDPEFFFEREGKIIGSEKVIDINTGLTVPEDAGNGHSKIIVDGVQCELNPRANTCRQLLGREIQYCFKNIYEKMQSDPKLKASFDATVTITPEELATLDDRSQVFGCAESQNTIKKLSGKIKVDAKTYPYRSAGGHIHIGAYSLLQYKICQTQAKRLVNILDIIVGNTCVLIDRDEGNKIRRQVYGKAGEYRKPAHGLEYRTLSNFWLKSYPLFSFVMGLTRTSMSILCCSQNKIGTNLEKKLLKLVRINDIRKAINENNFELAQRNFEKIRPFIEQYCTFNDPLHANNLAHFDYFVSKGIAHWFKEDPIQHWIRYTGTSAQGWERFLAEVVSPSLFTSQKEKAKQALETLKHEYATTVTV